MKASKYKSPKFHLINEYEYVKVERQTEGTITTGGEIPITWTEVYEETKASIVPMSSVSENNFRLANQGSKFTSIMLMIVEYDIDLQIRDRITREDDDIWYVYGVKPFPNTHKEAIILINEETL